MKKFKAKVSVNIKKEIKYIKAKTLEQAVSHLIRVKTVAEEILANSVIEEYEILWEKVQ